MAADGSGSIFNTREVMKAADFELMDYWDEGEPLDVNQEWPVCVTLNLISAKSPPTYFLDATPQEEASIPLRLLLLFSFSLSGTRLQSMRLMGDGEIQLESMTQLLEAGENHARKLFQALESKLREEDLRRNQKAQAKFDLR